MEEESKGSSKISAPSTEIPRRSSLESLFTSGGGSGVCPTSLSHTTLVSNYFPDNYPADGTAEFRSFSQLLAGAMTASPSAGVVGGTVNLFGEYWNHEKEGVMCGGDNNEKEGSVGLGGSYKQNRPGSLMVPPASSAAGGGSISPLFPISPGFSPSLFFNSAGPGFLTPATQSPLGMSHQQALAQVTAQAAAPAQQHHHHHQPQLLPNPPDHHQQYMFSSSSSALLPAPFFTNHHLHLDHHSSTAYDEQQPVPLLHPPKLPRDRKSQPQPQPQPPPLAAPVDKPADDGYNWRKYGQKQVKGSEYPRSYYKCTTPSCPVKKKVERSFDGHITEIIYKGQHNHEPPKNGRRSKDAALSISSLPPGGGGYSTTTIHDQGHHHHHQWVAAAGDDDSAQAATSLQLHGPSDSEESAGDHDAVQKRLDIHDDQYDEQGGNHKRRNTGDGSYEVGAMSHKTVTEPKIIVQTRSDVDLLDDGYRWRKYGQKVVKGNPNPRSYYKCTTAGCNVRKQVERSSTDSKAVITTYEGKHTHDVPAARHSATITNATAAADTSRHDTTQQQHMNGLSIPFLQLKEEKTK